MHIADDDSKVLPLRNCERLMIMHGFLFLFATVVAATPMVDRETLEATLIVTNRSDELFRAWQQPSVAPIEIPSVKVAKRGEFLAAVVLFKNCVADASGNCTVLLDIKTVDPNGKIYGQVVGVELWRGKPPPTLGRSQLGVDYMGLVIERQDPAGRYKVVAKARDLIGGAEVLSETYFDVLAPRKHP